MATVEINQSNYADYFTSAVRTGEFAPSENTYVLTGDLTFSSNIWMVLGASETFDGDGHVINMGTTNFGGLFATGGTSLETGSVVKNLGVLGGTISSDGGAVIRSFQKYFRVENCYSTGL